MGDDICRPGRRAEPGPLPLPPVRPDIRADGPAFGADYPRSEQRNLHIPGPMIDVDDGLVPALVAFVALVALDRKRPHAILAHIGKRHRLDWYR
jgi:hypothetical protein